MTEQEVKDRVRAVLRLMKPEFTQAMFSSGSWKAYSRSSGHSIPLWSFDLTDFDGSSEESLVEREE